MKKNFLQTGLAIGWLLAGTAVRAGPPPATEAMKLTLAAPISTWDEALPLGNGLLGGLLWGGGGTLRLSLDRGDLWDERPAPGDPLKGFTYARLKELVAAKDNEAVIKMLKEIGTLDRVDAYIERVKAGEVVLQGFGHRVYKSYDPRARIVKKIADDVFAVTGKNPLLDIALKLEEVALSDDYFISRRLYPNVDFYTGLIYQAMGFPMEMFTVLFAIPRMAGWLAHWKELLAQDSKIARPRQIYIGEDVRDYVSISGRS